jgi:tRNA pseudouridine38-40 synthase
MRTLKLTIAYDGTGYAGWQIQRGKPTIQGTLQETLRQILQEPVNVIGSGRTDAGVHAEAQVAHARIRSAMPLRRLLRSLNRLLPADIVVTRLDEAGSAFHARFGAKRKRYRYRVATGAIVSPFIRAYVHHVPMPLNVRLMQREAAALKGRHNFAAFGNAGSVRRSGSIRAITAARVRRRGREIHLDLEGNGFLHTMARSIAGTLIDVGRGRLPAGTVQRLLKTRNRSGAGTVAPARGLSLLSVTYSR